MKQKSQTALGRRDVLRVFATGATAAAASATPLASAAVADSESNDEKRKPRYKESEHIKKFYRVNRYPG
ncbi:MAG TPA: formate dehydrogenase [Xanthobacteraceae bacterium]|jgi:ABC-type sulfate transport system substrate-binding protein|nr:formate dehydrogenase [Xanthobacteraceae bacterium]